VYEQVKEAKSYIENQITSKPKIMIVLGSGLTSIVDELEDRVAVSYTDIPHFKVSTVKGHASNLVFGTLAGKDVALMTGRFHFYEGYNMKEMTFPFYVLKMMGIEHVILTNSCGGINSDMLEPGSIMTINDFINLMPFNPLIGPNDERFGPRFPDMTEPYSVELREIVKEKSKALGIPFVEGVYAGFQGPYYETKAEINMIRMMGADAVGMSTVPETIVCNYLGMNVLAFATITNMATGIQKQKHSHDNVVRVAKEASTKLATLIKEVVKEIEE